MKRRFFALTLILLLAGLLVTACSGNTITGNEGSSIEQQTVISSPPSSQEDALQTNILNKVLDSEADNLTGFIYCGNAPYVQTADGELIPENGVSSGVFTCQSADGGPYADDEAAMAKKLAEAFKSFKLVQDFSEKITADTVLPDTKEYVSFWLTLGDWEPFLYVFDSGDVYFSSSRENGAPCLYKALDAAQYPALKKAVEDIRAQADALPMDYQFSVGVFPDRFNPESTALRLLFENIGKQPVEFSRSFVVEKEVNGVWQPLREKEPQMVIQQMLTVAPRGKGQYAIDLTNLEGGQEPGKYRVSNTFYAGTEALTYTVNYEISADAMVISNPFPPEMTPENQAYCERYVRLWGFYPPFENNFTEKNYIQNPCVYLLYSNIVHAEGKTWEYNEKYGADIPAEIVEGTIQKHFLFTSRQLEAATPTKAEKDTEYYDPKTHTYHFERAHGGGSIYAVVSDSRREGDKLILTCDWYAVEDDGFYYRHVLTIQLGKNEDDFKYIENTVIKRAS